MSALLALIRKVRQAQAPRMSDEEAACRIDYLLDEAERLHRHGSVA